MTWDERITNAEAFGEFTVEDKVLSHNFGTCAVSEHYGRYETAPLLSGSPEDWLERYGTPWSVPASPELFSLGVRFNAAVMHHDVPEARTIYSKIAEVLL